MRRKRGKMRVKKRENHSDPIYANPIKNLPINVKGFPHISTLKTVTSLNKEARLLKFHFS